MIIYDNLSTSETWNIIETLNSAETLHMVSDSKIRRTIMMCPKVYHARCYGTWNS